VSAVVYTDGSGTTGGPAGIAFVAEVGGLLIEASLPLANATNQQAEILAAAYALTELDPCERVLVRSDSEYLVKGVTEWLPRWIENGWRTGRGRPVLNQRHWQRLLTAMELHALVEFRWVRGHAGAELNERADVLAGEARRRAQEAVR
jgi:ribonuclease HI